MIKILQRSRFKKQYKKLHSAQKVAVKNQIKGLLDDPLKGVSKKGALVNTRVVKFKLDQQLILLAYEFDVNDKTIILEALGSHENFYRDLERRGVDR